MRMGAVQQILGGESFSARRNVTTKLPGAMPLSSAVQEALRAPACPYSLQQPPLSDFLGKHRADVLLFSLFCFMIEQNVTH